MDRSCWRPRRRSAVAELHPESFESYQILRSDLQTQEIEIEDAVEEPSVAWFVDRGKVQDELTWRIFTRTLDTVYTAPREAPAATSGLVTVWLVAQDQRGGEA